MQQAVIYYYSLLQSCTTMYNHVQSCTVHNKAHIQHTHRVIRGLTGQTIVRSAAELGNGQLLLAELHNCTVYILGALDALWMYALEGCRVYGGPIQGATFVDGMDLHCGEWDCALCGMRLCTV